MMFPRLGLSVLRRLIPHLRQLPPSGAAHCWRGSRALQASGAWSLSSVSQLALRYLTRPGKLTVCELENGHRNREFSHEKHGGFP